LCHPLAGRAGMFGAGRQYHRHVFAYGPLSVGSAITQIEYAAQHHDFEKHADLLDLSESACQLKIEVKTATRNKFGIALNAL
jgi:hypothetical protein